MTESMGDLKIKTGLSLEYAQNILVRDIDCRECFLDLIDNSIDAARNQLIKLEAGVDSRGMPESYEGFEVNIGFDKKEETIYIEDNCSGIEMASMQDRLLVIGEESNEPFSIGHFGVGLKRAFLKLGRNYSIKTSHGGELYLIECSSKDLTDSASNVLAKHVGESKSTFTQIRISNVSQDAIREVFNADTWESELKKELSIRYSIYIKKKLVIKVKNIPVLSHCPGLREYKTIQIQNDQIEGVPRGVSAKISAGLHEEYLFREEMSKNVAKKNEDLTEEYGWYFVCNDRVIKAATRDVKFGWAKKWHPEYYGFVGWVYFSGEAKNLPWNTKKTDIDPSSDVFSAVKGHLTKYATQFRTQNRKLKKNKDYDSGEDSQAASQMDMLSAAEPNSVSADTSAPPQLGLVKSEVNSSSDASNVGVRQTPKKDNKETKVDYRKKTRIDKSGDVISALQSLGSQKLLQLYNSLCLISLVEHPVLTSVGAWSFFETLAKLSGADSNTSFSSFFNGKINEWYSKSKDKRAVFKKLLEDISQRGNLDKHQSAYYTVDARQLAVDFNVLEPLIIRIIEDIVDKKIT